MRRLTAPRMKHPRVHAATLVLLLSIGTAMSLAAQPVRTQDGGIIVNFQNAELAVVLSSLARAASINFFAADLPSKLVTLSTPRPITTAEAAVLIRNLAEANGITVVQEGPAMRLQGTSQAQGPDARALYIYRLNHARAPVLAQTLQTLFGGPIIAGAAQAGRTTMTQQLRAMEMQMQQRPGQGPVIITQPTVARAELEANITIVPDEVTNSLLVRATPADWQIVQQALQALDLRPLQVVIEVVIAEVRRNNELDVGVSFRSTDATPREGEMTTGGITRTPGQDDFSLRIVRTGDIDIDATLSALARSGNVRILSRPIVHAQNNQEAHISVGEQRPFIQVSRQLPTNEPVRDDVVSYIDVATALTIVPTINADGYVNLAVTQEVNSATEVVQFGAPVISTREATTQILARNGQTVVIGGLVDRQRDRSRSGVPLLKDIPILGLLFGSTRANTINSELFLFLTPYIVASDADADRVREEIERKADEIRPLVPIVPILPPVIRPDTIRGAVRR
jgi:general secretion pathway protein D